jgi:hypothetical protein
MLPPMDDKIGPSGLAVPLPPEEIGSDRTVGEWD